MTESRYVAETRWSRDPETSEADFTAGRYSRRHAMLFDGGAEVAGSPSLHNVPLPWSDPAAVDPEEAFVASLSTCHMLFFLHFAAKAGWCVDSYVDRADGVLARNAAGRMAMTRVTLRPETRFAGERRPEAEEIERLHHLSHDACFIANSVTTDVRCEPVPAETR